jgi:hypothetical protein
LADRLAGVVRDRGWDMSQRSGAAGGVPVDLVLLLGLAVPAAALAVYLTFAIGGPFWLLGMAAFVVALWFVTMPTRRRRRVDADGRRRQVGHDDSWTSSREEE